MSEFNYWREALDCSLDEHCSGVVFSEDQLNAIAKDMERAAEMKSEAMGYLDIPNPLRQEIAKLQSCLEVERKKIGCRVCGGIGSITSGDNVRSSTSACWKCHGYGKHLP